MNKIIKKALDDKKYLDIVNQILVNEEFILRKEYFHHNERTVYDHSIMVSYCSFIVAKKMLLDYKSAAIGGLLHDFYYKDWQLNGDKKRFFEQHGFVHAKEAYINSNIFFSEILNEKICDIIQKHMFPLNITPPKYMESWIIVFVDKYISLEIFRNPKKLYKYIGIKERK